MFGVVCLGVVAGEDVVAEVVVGVPPDAVDMVTAHLRVFELDEEAGALQAVVMRCPALLAASPAEVDVLNAGAPAATL